MIFSGYAAQDVTGSEIAINYNGKNILIECGMHQSSDILKAYNANIQKLPIKASKIYTSPSGAKLIMSGFLRQYSDNVTWIDTRQRKAKLEITLYGRKKEIVLPAVEI